MLTGLAASYPTQDAVAAVTALICLRYLAGENDPLADARVIRSQQLARWLSTSTER